MTAYRVRAVLAALVELVGFGLIVYACALLATWLGCLIAGLIAIGVAVIISPPRPGPHVQDDQFPGGGPP